MRNVEATREEERCLSQILCLNTRTCIPFQAYKELAAQECFYIQQLNEGMDNGQDTY